MSGEPTYTTEAELYDVIYNAKPYAAEAARIDRLLQAEGVPRGARVCEAACGTGAYLVHLAHWYAMTGIDLHPAVLEVARRKVPNVPLMAADMRSFQLESPVRALLCLFSSIGYLADEHEVGQALAAFHAALEPGGVVVIEPWLAPEVFRPNSVHMQTSNSAERAVCRQGYSRLEGSTAVLEMHWMVGEADRGVRTFTEIHRMLLLPRERMLELLTAAGFRARFEPEGLMAGRGLYVGRRD